MINLYITEELARRRQQELREEFHRERIAQAMATHTPGRRVARSKLPQGWGVLLAELLVLTLATQAHARQVLSVAQLGGAGSDEAFGIAVDGVGSRYVTGSFEGQARFGSGSRAVTLTTRGLGDMFVAKYDAAGDLV